jgi:hypothetical protein
MELPSLPSRIASFTSAREVKAGAVWDFRFVTFIILIRQANDTATLFAVKFF